jgi:hypothetical protein
MRAEPQASSLVELQVIALLFQRAVWTVPAFSGL